MSGCGCGCAGTDAQPCGCCAGTEPITPESRFNRPGLPALRYRAGTHGTFLETMKAALSADRRLDGLTTREASDASIALLDAWATVGDVLTFYQERIANEGFLGTATERRSVLELANLVGYRARPGVSASVLVAYTLDDGAKAVIPEGSLVRSVPADGEAQQAFETSEPLEAQASWNNLQVRLTRPHTKASILSTKAIHLDGLVGTLKAGDPLFVEFGPNDTALCRVVEVVPDAPANRTKVTLEEWAPSGNFQIAAGSALEAANRLRPFLRIETFGLTANNATVKGVLPLLRRIVNTLDANSLDVLADIDAIGEFLEMNPPRAVRAKEWIEQLTPALILDSEGPGPVVVATLPDVDDIVERAGLLTAPSLSPRSQYHRADDIKSLFAAKATDVPQPPPGRAKQIRRSTGVAGATLATLTAFRPALQASLAIAFAKAAITKPSPVKVYSVIRTSPFGHNAGPRATTNRIPRNANQPANQPQPEFSTTFDEWDLNTTASTTSQLDLEREFEQVRIVGLVAVQQTLDSYGVFRVRPSDVTTVSRADYGLAGKATRIVLGENVITIPANPTLAVMRPIKVFLADALLPLAEQPIPDPVCGSDPEIELNGLYDGLTPGRWMILTGERADTPGTSGVQATELLLIGDVQHHIIDGLPGDRLHTFLEAVVPSAYCYKRDTVRIYGNVVKATNGETRKEVLGSGDASVPFQQFPLKQPPLTHLAAPTASGSESTLRVYVNDLEWHESPSLVGLGADERRFFTKTNDEQITTVIFGDGVTGARVPTGNANLRTAYRNGIGKGGNVQAGQLTLLGSKPYGVKEVTNPLRASGGADRDSRDQIRVNAPLSVTALDRLVSIDDYAHFARTFAGIGKADAVSLTDGHRQLVHVTIAGIDDIPIDPTSDLYLNLRRAMRRYGDPYQPLQLDVRTAKFLVLQAGVKVHPERPWEYMAPALRAALLDAFRFERRELGQSAFLSEVLDVLQRVPGVEFVDADRFGALLEEQLTPSGIAAAIAALDRREMVQARFARTGGPFGEGIAAAEIAYFTPDVPATIALNQL